MLAGVAPQTERFVLKLSTAAPAADLRAWFEDARPGEPVEYASGIALPREAEGVRLVTRWKDAGLVLTTQKRDPADGRRWLFLVQRTSIQNADGPPSSVGAVDRPAQGAPAHAVDRATLNKLLSTLRSKAERGLPCPSNTDLAHELGLPRGSRGRMRAKYLMARLVTEKRIAVECRGTTLPRVVTILAAGRARGKETAR